MFAILVRVLDIHILVACYATLHPALSVRPSVRPSVRRSVTFLNCERFLHYSPCPPVRDCLAVYPALFFVVEIAVLAMTFCVEGGVEGELG